MKIYGFVQILPRFCHGYFSMMITNGAMLNHQQGSWWIQNPLKFELDKCPWWLWPYSLLSMMSFYPIMAWHCKCHVPNQLWGYPLFMETHMIKIWFHIPPLHRSRTPRSRRPVADPAAKSQARSNAPNRCHGWPGSIGQPLALWLCFKNPRFCVEDPNFTTQQLRVLCFFLNSEQRNDHPSQFPENYMAPAFHFWGNWSPNSLAGFERKPAWT